MLKVWTLLLVCGLLPCSQGVADVLSQLQLDKSVLEGVISETVSNGVLLQGLLSGGGGGLLGGLTGGLVGGLTGDVLGGQGGGLAGGLLGGEGGGLLGGLTTGVLGGQGGGLAGGLLGGEGGGLLGGLTTGVLGGQGGGLAGGLLGGEGGGLLGGLTGGGVAGGLLGGEGGGLLGGLTAGVLGGQGGGVAGNLLGGEGGGLLGGLTEGVLGGQGGGLAGNLLGGEGGGLLGGLTGGVLGGQEGGLLGGVLGGQGGGLLGGVLGGQGGGLLGGVLGGQDGGLLGGVLGGQGGLLGLKIVDIVLPKVSVKLLEGVGVELNIYTKVELKGNNSPLLGMLNLLVEANITGRARMVQDRSGAPRLVIENCKTLLGGIKILSGLPLLNPVGGVLGNLLSNLLPGLLCPVIDLVLNVLNILLGTVNAVCPFGMLGQLHYTLASLPLFRGQQIILNLNLMITDPEGKTINLPPVQLPALPAPVPGDRSSQLVLPGQLLTTLIGTLGSKGLLNADITQQTLRGNVPMTTAALQSLVPEISQLGISSLPLVVRIRLNGVPKVALQNGEVSVTLGATIGVLAQTRSGPRPLFEVDANIGLRGKITAGSSKLSFSLSLKSLALKVTSSEIGVFNVLALERWLGSLIASEYLPVVNDALAIGIPLPQLFNLKYDDAVVSVVQDALVVGVTPKLV